MAYFLVGSIPITIPEPSSAAAFTTTRSNRPHSLTIHTAPFFPTTTRHPVSRTTHLTDHGHVCRSSAASADGERKLRTHLADFGNTSLLSASAAAFTTTRSNRPHSLTIHTAPFFPTTTRHPVSRTTHLTDHGPVCRSSAASADGDRKLRTHLADFGNTSLLSASAAAAATNFPVSITAPHNRNCSRVFFDGQWHEYPFDSDEKKLDRKKLEEQRDLLIYANHIKRRIILSARDDHIFGVIVDRDHRKLAKKFLEEKLGRELMDSEVGWSESEIKRVVCLYEQEWWIKRGLTRKTMPHSKSTFKWECFSIRRNGQPDSNTVARNVEEFEKLRDNPELKNPPREAKKKSPKNKNKNKPK